MKIRVKAKRAVMTNGRRREDYFLGGMFIIIGIVLITSGEHNSIPAGLLVGVVGVYMTTAAGFSREPTS